MDLSALIRQNEPLRDALISLVVVITVLLGRGAALRALTRSKLPTETQIRWKVHLRNVTIGLIVAGVITIWAQELRAVAISVAAVAAALVIATKEFIMCLMGTTLRASVRGFKVGDRIEINGIRGDVIDIGPLTTSILEAGPGSSMHQHTGRVVVIPNSLYLTTPVTNESFAGDYVLDVLRVPVRADADWEGARDRLLTIAVECCAEHIENAREALQRAAGDQRLLAPQVEPSVYVELPEPERVELLLRFSAPARARGRLAQEILQRYLGEGARKGKESKR